VEKNRRLPDEIRRKVNRVALLVLDVDGVLTPPYLFYGSCLGEDAELFEGKCFNVHDGSACWVAREAGLILAIISGRDSEIVRNRASKLKIEEVFLGHLNKMSVMEDLKKKYELKNEQIAFMSDDYLDLPLLQIVGLPIAVNDSVEEVIDVAAIITERKGGCGAVREAIKLILSEQGKWESGQKRVLQKIYQEERAVK